MRTVTSDVASAIAASSRQMHVQATVYKMRTYFSSLSHNNPPAWEDLPPENDNEPIAYPSDVTYASGVVITAVPYNDRLCLMKEGSATVTQIYMSPSTYLTTRNKPSITGNYIFYYDMFGGVKRATVNWATYVGGSGACVTAIDSLPAGSIVAQAIYATSENVVVAVGIHDGGIAVDRFSNNAGWSVSTWSNVFTFPTVPMLAGNLELCFYSAAVSLGTAYNVDTVVYVTSPEDGSVQAVRYDAVRGRWTDTWTALQSDLSEFRCMKAFYYNSKVLLLGQFARTKELHHDPIPLLLSSDDGGRHFSTDQFSLISKLGWRFMACISSNTLYASDLNRIGESTIGAAHGNASASSTSIANTSIISFGADTSAGNSTASLSLKASDEVFAGDSNIIKYNRCKVEIGYLVADGGIDYTEYDTYIIQAVNSLYADGQRSFTLGLVQESIWRVTTQSPPFYVEIFGKSGMKDDLKDESHMSSSGNAYLTETYLSVDFWNSESFVLSGCTGINILDEGGVKDAQGPAGTHALSFVTQDLNTKLNSVDYPTILSYGLTLSLYGIGRTVDAGDTNEDFALYLLIERGGVPMILPCTLTSTYSRFPKTYNGVDANGNNPIVFGIDSTFRIGDKIKHIAVKAYKTGGTGIKYWTIERVALGGNGVRVTYMDQSTAGIKIIEPTTSYLGGFQLTGYGRHIRLCDKPYAMYNGNAIGKFHIAAGNAPSTAGMHAVGLVLLAENANNCILGRYVRMPADTTNYPRWEIVKIREGVETILAFSAKSDCGLDLHFLFRHNHQQFGIYKFTGATLDTTALVYNWTSSDGPICTTSDVAILHPGIYMEKSTLNFRCTGFDSDNAAGIAMLSGESGTIFDNLPASGKVSIDNKLYTYGSKSSHALDTYGPYQGIWADEVPEFVSDTVTYVKGVYLENRLYSWISNATYHHQYDGYCLSADNGSSWKLGTTDWKQVWGKDEAGTEGTPKNLTRHGPNMTVRGVGKSDRTYIGPALYGIVPPQEGGGNHDHGARVYLYGSETIGCNYFIAFSYAADTTVKDMISLVAKSVGTSATFSGDYAPGTIALSANAEYELL